MDTKRMDQHLSHAKATGDYEIDRQRHVSACNNAIEDDLRILTGSPKEIMQLRDMRLKALLKHAIEHSSWHKERLVSVDINELTGEDLSSIPIMTKSDLMDNWDQIVCDPRLNLSIAEEHLRKIVEHGPQYLLDECHVVASGGTTGNRCLFVWDFDSFAKGISRNKAWAVWIAQHLPRPDAGYPIRMVSIAATNPVHFSYTSQRCFSDPNLITYFPVDSQIPIKDIIDQLNEIKPHILFGYTTITHEIAKRKLAGELQFEPHEVLLGSEALLPEAKECIDMAFGPNVRDIWGSTEVGAVASQVPGTEGMIISEDLVILEPVDLNNNPVGLGEPAEKLLATNLVNKILPLIRYEIGDRTVVLPPDPKCPWYGHRLASVTGRVEDLFYYSDHSIMIHPTVFETVLSSLAGVPEYQVQQTEHGVHVLLCMDGHVKLDLIQQYLTEAVARAGLMDPVVTVQAVDRIQRHPGSGKLKRFVGLS